MGVFENIYNSASWFGKERMQMPGVASVGNAFGNLKGGFMFGLTGDASYYSPTKGGFRGTPFNFKRFANDAKDVGEHAGKLTWNPQFSLGGMMTAGYGAIGGAVSGAAIGAAGGALMGANPVTTAIGGAAIGGVALAAAPVAAGLAARGAGAALAATPKAFAAVGDGMIKGTALLGKAANSLLKSASIGLSYGTAEAFKYGRLAGGLGGGLNAAAHTVLNPVSRGIGAIGTIAKAMVKKVPDNGTGAFIKNYKFSGFGLSVMAAGSLLSGTKKAFNTFMEDKMGQRDGYISTSTPQIRLMDDAGATGDLVFALNNNRRG